MTALETVGTSAAASEVGGLMQGKPKTAPPPALNIGGAPISPIGAAPKAGPVGGASGAGAGIGAGSSPNIYPWAGASTTGSNPFTGVPGS